MHNPGKYLHSFVRYWSDDANSPSVEGVTITNESLQLWKKETNRKSVKKLAAHRFLPGLCRTYANNSFDFCMNTHIARSWPL